MALTREQIMQGIESLESQGASQPEVQEWINSSSGSSSYGAPQKTREIPTRANGQLNVVADNKMRNKEIAQNLSAIPKQQRTQAQRSQLTDARLTNAGNAIGGFFGGNVIGQRIGTSISNALARQKDAQFYNDPALQELQIRNPQAYNKIVSKGSGQTIDKGPTTGQIVGDVVKAGSNFVGAGIANKGVQAGKLAVKGLPQVTKNVIPRLLAEGTGVGAMQGFGEGAIRGESVGNIAKDTAIGAGIGLATAGTLGLAGKGLQRVAERIKPGASVQRAISRVDKELRNIENNYSTLRKAKKFNKNIDESRMRVIQADVLSDVIDENGLINTTKPGGAIDQYRVASGLDESEGVVRQNLANYKEVADINNIRAKLIEKVSKSGLEGADLARAMRSIDKEIAGYAQRADQYGRIPLVALHDAKVSQYKNINFMTAPEVNTYRKSIAEGLKELVEENSQLNIKEINQDLSKYLKDIEYLESLNGKRVQGGKLGKYFAQISGNMIGATVGGAVGGPVGSAMGTIAGGELAGIIKGKLLKRTFGKEIGSELQKSPIIEQAITKAKNKPGLPALIQGRDYTPVSGGSKYSPIPLPARSQSLVDNQSNRLGSTNTKYNTVNTTRMNPPINDISETVLPTNTPVKGKSVIPKKKGIMDILKDQRGFATVGYKEKGDLTTKILKDLEGKPTVSKQYILDATNRGELKQVERDLIRDVLTTEKGDTVNVANFAKKVKAELLPLKVSNRDYKNKMGRYENIALPDELRGNIKNYEEHLFESPIKVSADSAHFPGQAPGYFGHTRIEDMADNKTRRVIEVQSDLYQKGNLQREINNITSLPISAREEAKRLNKLSKLQQYNDPTAHFRMIREEIKKAAQDGKTKLQFPTGETAMKIEGLGQENAWFRPNPNESASENWLKVKPDELKVGETISNNNYDDWIITDVLGDGRFKAVSKNRFEMKTNEFMNEKELAEMKDAYSETFDISDKVDTNNPIYKFYEKDVQKYLNKFGGKRIIDDRGVSWIEIPITKEQGKMPVEAFGRVKLGAIPIIGGATFAGMAGASVLAKSKKKKLSMIPNKK